MPAEHGGLGGDFGFECVVYEELLHAGFACFGKGVHEIATHYVLDYGTDEQRRGLGAARSCAASSSARSR